MTALIRQLLAAAALCLATGASLAQASTATAEPAPKGPPDGFVVPADPKPGDSNAERARSQPGNNAPMWRAVRDSGLQPGSSSLPGAEQGVLIQPFVQYPGSRLTNAGEAWRQVRNQWLLPYGGSLLLIVVVALGLFYWKKGALGQDHPDAGLVIERFTPLERAAHWTNAIAFVTLAISGIVMAFGKFFLLPVLGSSLFGWLTYALKTAHNFVGPLFAVSLVIVLVTFVKDNIATIWDVRWLVRGGGLLGGEQVPSHRFNPAEKGMFWWGICVPGIVVVGSGLVLDKLLPGLDYLRGDMQVAHMIHAVASVIMMVFLLGHIYMGTIGTRGAYKAMRTGYVNEGWAREHHALWLDDVKAGKIPVQRSTPAGAAPPVGDTPARA
ncbi:MAG: formate dehydrogenase subunit gamma [Aquabacterium sp.]|nr:formate dehydrogenase subunit gamma [Aquabacterium sp.]